MKVDSIIFDIDGVLIDVSRSFRMIIAMVVADYLKTFEGYFGPAVLTPEMTQIFKDRGGFNNDWDLTEGTIILSLYLKDRFGRFTPITELPQWYEGGGVDELYQMCKVPRLNREWIVRRFQALYAGRRYCQRLYGFEPDGDVEGLINEERIVLKKEMLSEDFEYGIVTGRTREETELAIERLGFEPSFFKVGILWEITKPDPEPLKRLSFRNGIYLGDTIDDWEMVKRFEGRDRSLSFIFIKPPFRKDFKPDLEGILYSASDVNNALEWILHRNRGEWT